MTRYRSQITIHRTRKVAAAAAIAALVAGCGSSGSSSSRNSGTSSAAATTGAPTAGRSTVTIASFAYAPAKIAVKKGAAVTFNNKDNASHTVSADNGSFDSGTLQQGASKAITFSNAGTFTFHCAFHPFMHGTVVVK
jgi:plastocyanin